MEEVLELVGLPGFGKRDVNTLSGGEEQRVALACSLAPRPRLLMLDEPLGSLDRNLRDPSRHSKSIPIFEKGTSWCRAPGIKRAAHRPFLILRKLNLKRAQTSSKDS